MNTIIDKIEKKHSELLDFYNSEKLTERERNLLRSEMAFLLEIIEDTKALNMRIVGVTLPTEEQLASDKDEICFRGSINQSVLDKRRFLEKGFMLGYNYLLSKINGN